MLKEYPGTIKAQHLIAVRHRHMPRQEVRYPYDEGTPDHSQRLPKVLQNVQYRPEAGFNHELTRVWYERQ